MEISINFKRIHFLALLIIDSMNLECSFPIFSEPFFFSLIFIEHTISKYENQHQPKSEIKRKNEEEPAIDYVLIEIGFPSKQAIEKWKKKQSNEHRRLCFIYDCANIWNRKITYPWTNHVPAPFSSHARGNSEQKYSPAYIKMNCQPTPLVRASTSYAHCTMQYYYC